MNLERMQSRIIFLILLVEVVRKHSSGKVITQSVSRTPKIAADVASCNALVHAMIKLSILIHVHTAEHFLFFRLEVG